MKYIKSILIGIVLIFLISFFFLSRDTFILKDRVLDTALGDIDGDNDDEFIILTKGILSKYGKDVVIYSNANELNELYREDFSELKPWRIDAGDVDGDNIDEVSIGVYKETIFHKIMAKRPFIYSYIDNKLHPKWRGSRLSKPIVDYTFYDIDGDDHDEIISIETLENEQMVLNSYKWRGFGFEGFLEGQSNYLSLELSKEENGVIVYVLDEGTKFMGQVIIKDNLLVIERMGLK